LLAPLLDGPPRRVPEAARTRLSVHYETGDPAVPVLCVGLPDAVRLPNLVLVHALPAPGLATVGAGMLVTAHATWRVSRWWSPPRPAGLAPPPSPERLLEWTARASGDPAVRPSYDGLRPATLLGRGPGLTPAGDDLLAGALVTAHATGDPRLPGWRSATWSALARRRTTVVSRGLLRHALDGYAIPELADTLVTLSRGGDVAGAVRRLLGVGHSSGPALLSGVAHTLSTRALRSAA
jgi:hypothetical protein